MNVIEIQQFNFYTGTHTPTLVLVLNLEKNQG